MAEWTDLLDPGEEELKKVLPPQIHERALEQLLAPAVHDDEPRARLEGHDHYLFGVFLLPIAIREEDRVFYQEVDIIATRERVVTVRKTPERGYPCDLGPAQISVAKSADDRAGMMWGDCGAPYWLSRREEMTASDLAPTSFTWQCALPGSAASAGRSPKTLRRSEQPPHRVPAERARMRALRLRSQHPRWRRRAVASPRRGYLADAEGPGGR